MTTTVYQRFRRDVLGPDSADDDTTLPDDAIDDLLDEAEETYSVAKAQAAYGRVLYLRGRLAALAEETDYRIAETQESAGDAYEQVEKLLARWEGILAAVNVPDDETGGLSLFAVASGCRGR